MFLHHFVCSVHFPTVQKHTDFETIPHLYWKNDKGFKPANGFQPAFLGHSVNASSIEPTVQNRGETHRYTVHSLTLIAMQVLYTTIEVGVLDIS